MTKHVQYHRDANGRYTGKTTIDILKTLVIYRSFYVCKGFVSGVLASVGAIAINNGYYLTGVIALTACWSWLTTRAS